MQLRSQSKFLIYKFFFFFFGTLILSLPGGNFISVHTNRDTRRNGTSETCLIRKAVTYHLDNICQSISAKNIIYLMYTDTLLTPEEYEFLSLKIEPFKATGQAKTLFQFLLEPKNDSKVSGLMKVMRSQYPDIYDTINRTISWISTGSEEQEITGS